MDESRFNLLRRIPQSVTKVAAQGREVITVAPFQALLDPSTDMICSSEGAMLLPTLSARV